MKKHVFILGPTILLLFAIVGVSYTDHGKESFDEKLIPLYLYAEDTALQRLYADPHANNRIDGYIKLGKDGEVLHLDGFRFRGNSARDQPKKSFNIIFDQEQDFLYGSNRMNLNATYTDPTMMREKLSMDMFLHLGQVAPRTRYFELHINDVFEGTYVQVERVDSDLLEYHGLHGRGTLVRDRFRQNIYKPEIDNYSMFAFDIDSVVDAEEFLKDNLDYRGNPNWDEVEELLRWVYNTPAGEEYYKGFIERFDIDYFIDWLAVHYLIGDVDFYADDYWLYKDHFDESSKWKVIPWDKDLTFGSHTRNTTANDYFFYEHPIKGGWNWNNELILKFLDTKDLRLMLFERIEELMNEVFTIDYFKTEIEYLEAIIGEQMQIEPSEENFHLHQANHHSTPKDFDYQVEALIDFVNLRYENLNRQLNPITDELVVIDVNDYDIGDTVFFTDAIGWVIAKFEITSIDEPGNVSISIKPHENSEHKGLNKVWNISSDGCGIKGNLSLFCRNDVAYGHDPEDLNWFISSQPVSDENYNQWDLKARYVGSEEYLETKVNPYSNKVTIIDGYLKDSTIEVDLR
ncbi:hypothetical protein SYNTR_1866 [Candidatus Syntrophocurvum alkaliphilum]|uniref:Inner spore coat protein H n=1 Tax=Candidatus Syntrophocurvum alkaliphilum TaxID=2293317 RepID=A0A6I6DKH2_9FIRM|nr:CotH kinase family protein [Candidatus Syntrophocurvum alkaliphilum]QGU00460.1 hypothetical protein SYNTR_1866 [Candidatus Syntrophocurvum alkaliphilum]